MQRGQKRDVATSLGSRSKGRRVAALVRRTLTVALLLLAFLTYPPTSAYPQQIQATDIQVKAAFLLNFGRYATWPRPPENNFLICVLGHDPFGQTLDSIVAGEKIASQPAEVRRVQTVQEASSCHVLYISDSEELRLQATLVSLAKTPVLTVSDAPRFADQGGMIQFVLDGNRVRFIVNLGAAQRAGLTLSSELLKVAKTVTGNGSGGGR